MPLPTVGFDCIELSFTENSLPAGTIIYQRISSNCLREQSFIILQVYKTRRLVATGTAISAMSNLYGGKKSDLTKGPVDKLKELEWQKERDGGSREDLESMIPDVCRVDIPFGGNFFLRIIDCAADMSESSIYREIYHQSHWVFIVYISGQGNAGR